MTFSKGIFGAEPSDRIEASSLQQRLWFIEKLVPGSCAYNICVVLTFSGIRDPQRLLRAFDATARRHGSLRACFHEQNGTLQLQITEPKALECVTDDLRSLDPSAAVAVVDTHAVETANQPFDLSQAPLLRLKLFRMPGGSLRLSLTIHHLVFDGWSLKLLIRDVLAAHAADGELPALDTDYVDYVAWEKSEAARRLFATQLSHWVEVLGSGPHVVELPSALQRPPLQTFKGRTQRFELSARTSRAARALASSSSATLFNVLLTAFFVTLRRYTNQPRLTVATPVVNRNAAASQQPIGYFTNVVAIATELPEGDTFEDLLRAVRGKCALALTHQDVPFGLVVDAVKPNRDLSRGALCQVLFSLQNAADAEIRQGDVVVRYEFPETGVTRYDLELHVFESGADLSVMVVYNSDCNEAESIARFNRHYANILEAALATPQVAWDRLPILSPEERQLQLEGWNQTQAPVPEPRCLYALFERTLKRQPEALALCGAEEVSYRELDSRARSIARRLHASGVRKGRRVGVVMSRNAGMIESVLGILKVGASYVPLDPGLPDERLSQLIKILDLRVFVSQAQHQSRLSSIALGCDVVLADAAGAELDVGDVTFEAAAPDDEAYVIFTSGSTGIPKGVSVIHRRAANVIHWVNSTFGVGASDKLLFVTSLSFDLSVYDIFGILAAGGSIRIATESELRDPWQLFRILADEGITFWDSAPAGLQQLVPAMEARVGTASSSLRLVFLSGDWVPLGLPDTVRGCFSEAQVVALGGATEATIWSNYFVVDEVSPRWRSVPYGTPISNARYYVLDRHREPVPVGVPGDLWIGGDCLALGYANDPELTAAKFVPDPFVADPSARMYATGDLTRHAASGVMEFLGRRDSQVKVRGYRVELGEVEATLRQHDGVASAFVLAKSRSGRERYLVAYVVLAPGSEATPLPELKNYLASKLPSYMVPEFFVPIESVPQTANGKLDQQALLSLADRSQEPEQDDEGEPSALEREMHRVWCAELATPKLRVTEDFFAAGGNSMVAVRIVATLERELGVAVPIARFFENPTIRELSRLIESGKVAPRDDVEVVHDPARRFESFPLTDMQQAYWIGHNSGFELDLVPHIYLELDLPELDVARLRSALAAVIERQEMLRAVVTGDGYQRILEHVPEFPLEVVDLRRAPESEVLQQMRARRQRGIESAPGPSSWPTFELAVAQTPGGVTLHACFNLTFCDGGSLVVFFRELQALYAGRELSPLMLSPRDYVISRVKARSGPKYARAREYWNERIPRLPPGPDLPRRRGGTVSDSPRHLVRYERSLGRAQWQRVKELARQHGVTPNVAMLGIYASTLAKWSKDPEFSLVVMYFNRPEAQLGLADMVGNFANTIILPVPALGSEQEFASFALALQAQLAADLQHADFSGVEVVREMSRLLGEAGRAVVPVTFASGLDIVPSAEPGQDWIRRVSFSSLQVPQVCIDHQIYEDADGSLRMHWDVSERTLPDGVAEQLVEASMRLLARMSDAAGWEESLVRTRTDQGARAALLSAWRRTPIASGLLHEPFLEAARRFPDQIALDAGRVRFTYRELERVSAQLAERLAPELKSSSLVGILLDKGWEQIVAALSILRAGGAYVPLHVDWPAHRIEVALASAGVTLVVTNRSLSSRLPESVRAIVDVAEGPIDASRSALSKVRVQAPGSVAYVIFTSGSTGVPKGVVIEHGSAVNTIVDLNRRLKLGLEDKVLALSALSFDLSVYDIFGTLAVGACLVVPDPSLLADARALSTFTRDSRITVWNSVPAYMGLVQEYLDTEASAPGLPTLRQVMLSGDWIPVDLPSRIRKHSPCAKILSLGGATEASIWSISHEIEAVDPTWTSIPYGRALSGQSLHVLNRTLEPCPDHVVGELYIGGAGLAREYLNDSEKTQAKFLVDQSTGERLYRTGDWGRRWPDGTIEFLGREDAQVKVQGYRVELGDVESCMLQHPGVASACVLATDSSGGRRLLAYYTTTADCSEATLREFLRERLPSYCVPSTLVRVAQIPLTSNGKVDRKALPAPGLAAPEGHSSLALDYMTARLQQVWGELLSVTIHDIDRDFFQLGGNSLTALRLVNRVQQEFSSELSVGALFRAPTIRQFAELLRRPDHDARQDVLIPIRLSGAERRLFLVHPIGGTVICYRGIAAALSATADVYGIQAPGMNGDQPGVCTIVELARLYVDALTSRFPEGPIDLAGWSLGGLIAFEMVRLLAEEGRPQARVVLIDSGFARAKAEDALSDAWCWQYFIADLRRLTSSTRGRSAEDSVPEGNDAATARQLLGDVSEVQVERLFRVFQANARAYVGFAPLPIDADIGLILARESDAKRDVDRWGDLTTGDLRTFDIEGDHHSIFEPQRSVELGALVQRALYEP